MPEQGGERMGPRLKRFAEIRPRVHRPHGKPRFYFRRRGFPSVNLPGLPWSPEFMAAYEDAMPRSRRRSVSSG